MAYYRKIYVYFYKKIDIKKFQKKMKKMLAFLFLLW